MCTRRNGALMSTSDRSEEAHRLADRLVAIGRACPPRLKEPYRSAEHGDLLYDELGLPR